MKAMIDMALRRETTRVRSHSVLTVGAKMLSKLIAAEKIRVGTRATMNAWLHHEVNLLNKDNNPVLPFFKTPFFEESFPFCLCV